MTRLEAPLLPAECSSIDSCAGVNFDLQCSVGLVPMSVAVERDTVCERVCTRSELAADECVPEEICRVKAVTLFIVLQLFLIAGWIARLVSALCVISAYYHMRQARALISYKAYHNVWGSCVHRAGK